MNKEFVPYEPSLALKELGFNEPCFGWYDGRYIASINRDYCKNSEEWLNTIHCATPTFSQAFRWFREKYGLFIQPNRTIDSEGTWYYFSIASKRTDVCDGSFVYEEAELECLKKLIEIVKNK